MTIKEFKTIETILNEASTITRIASVKIKNDNVFKSGFLTGVDSLGKAIKRIAISYLKE